MPMYPYRCHVCDKEFTVMRPIKDRLAAADCPECGRPSAFHLAGLTGVGIIDYVGVPPTVAQQAERNMKKYGKELVQKKMEAVDEGISPTL